MLSKYEHLIKKGAAARRELVQNYGRALAAALSGKLKQKYSKVTIEQILRGGTLGLSFELYINGKKKFAKTHLEGTIYQENLIKEIEIMSLLYEREVAIEKENVIVEKKQFTFMIMDWLFPCSCSPACAEVKQWINFYQSRLCKADIEVQYSFAQILAAGRESLKTLYALEFLTKDLYLQCTESLYRIENKKVLESEIISHGDLSNANILQDKDGRHIIIDWEDALTVFAEYDYLYWLTFFSQRKYYGPGLLKANGIDQIWGTDIMVLITIIKSKISYQNGSYIKNRMSFQDRIREIYEIAAG